MKEEPRTCKKTLQIPSTYTDTRPYDWEHEADSNLTCLMSSLMCVLSQIFHKPLLECELLTEKEVAMIFVNWKELIMCNIKLLK